MTALTRRRSAASTAPRSGRIMLVAAAGVVALLGTGPRGDRAALTPAA